VSLVEVLPLAVVMVAGPQILSAIFLATTEQWRANSVAYVAGASLSISLIVALAYLFSDGAKRQGASGGLFQWFVVALLLVAMGSTFLNRKESEPPEWMGKLTNATPRFSFRLGFLLLGFFPTDIVTAVSVGSYLAANDLPLTDASGYLALTLLFLGAPALGVFAFGARAEAFLPKARDWMNENSWLVTEAVLAFFIVSVLG